MPKVIENYMLERKIGSGQFGEVFKGRDTVTDQPVAVKCVRRDLLKGRAQGLLENEIKVLKGLSNHNIVRLLDIKKTAKNFYLVMEYCNEGDLMQYLREKKRLQEEEAVDLFCQLLNAFKHIVARNVIHRDLKLANILLSDGVVKVADFGFSRMLEGAELANTMLGSPLTMAPEGKDYQRWLTFHISADGPPVRSALGCLVAWGRPLRAALREAALLGAQRRGPVEERDEQKVELQHGRASALRSRGRRPSTNAGSRSAPPDLLGATLQARNQRLPHEEA